LNKAIQADARYAPSYVRLAEAETELDDAENAQNALLKVNELVQSESRLPFDDRMRFRAVRAIMLRDVDGGVRWYRELADRRSGDAGAWLDLGRAQDAAALGADARVSYEKAIQLDGQYAPPRLRRASILALEGRRAEALQAFGEAEDLYRAAANVEGEIETLIRRGVFLNGIGELAQARTALERARNLAVNLQSRAQEIRAQLQLSTVTASEGRWKEAEKMSAAAVESALREDLETVAADGFVDAGTILIHQRKWEEADALLLRAIQLAQQRGAQRIVERANLQRAYLMVQEERYVDALASAGQSLEYVQANRYRRYELTALSIMSRAHEGLGQYAEARQLASRALRIATDIKDEIQAGYALENLGGAANALGILPEALEHRARGLEIHRRLNDVATLPFDLVNRADLLIRVGRHSEAAPLLDELDGAIARKLEAYVPRARRVKVLRALSAAIQHRPDEVDRHTMNFPPNADSRPDSTSQLAAVLLQYAGGLRKSRSHMPPVNVPLAGSTTSPTGRELRYWDLAARLANSNTQSALSGVEETLASNGATVSYEFEWRIAAIGAAAARQLKDVERERIFSERARRALTRLRNDWKSDVASYESRPDLVELRRKAGL
jgi:tetratricopeptide (TPR) repeat protein